MKKLHIPMILYGCFCIFSLFAVIMHLAGSRTLITLELSKSYLLKIDDIQLFLDRVCVVTFFVGILRGLSALAILKRRFYYLPLGFTVASIIAVIVKMVIEVNVLSIVKLTVYLIMLAMLIADRKKFGVERFKEY